MERARRSVMQSRVPEAREPLNTESFLQMKETEVPVEDQFFYQFFKEKEARSNKKTKKINRELNEDEIDQAADKLTEEYLKKQVGSEDEDFVDNLINQFNEEENGRFLEEGEEEEMSELEGMDEEDEEEEEEESDGRMIVDENDDGSKEAHKQRHKKTKSLFASAEEFEQLLEQNTGEIKEKKFNYKRGGQKRKFQGKDKRNRGNKRRRS